MNADLRRFVSIFGAVILGDVVTTLLVYVVTSKRG